MSTPTLTPPGWYPNTEHPGQQHYWDGQAWRAVPEPVAPEPVASEPVASETKKPSRTAWMVGAVVLVLVVAGGAAIDLASHSTPPGYLGDVQTLQSSMMTTYNARMSAVGGPTVTNVGCVNAPTANQFICHIDWTVPYAPTTVTVAVATDGQSWISSTAQ